jgi:hypothetical protein
MDKQKFRQNELVIVSNDGKAWFEAYYIKKGGNNESGHWCHYGNVAYQKLWKYCEKRGEE